VVDSNNAVSVIDAATNTVTATIPVGSNLGRVAVDPAAGTVYVTDDDTGTVNVIDVATNAWIATVSVGSDPDEMAVDPAAGTVYVTDPVDETVSVIDVTTATVTATIPVGSVPTAVAVDPSTHTLYVATPGDDDTVSVIDVALPTPVITVTSSRNPSSFGQKVTLTAKADPADGGTMTFTSGSTTLCSAVSLTHVSGSTYKATCTTTALPAGRDTITAAYPGDASYTGSVGTRIQTVTRAPTALTESISLSPYQALILTATLTASGGPIGGQPVSFSTGSTHLCTPPDTSASGVAICVLTAAQTRLAERDHQKIRASYPGSTSYKPSSATAAPPQ
jgi:YVTN family beta-propeller protein